MLERVTSHKSTTAPRPLAKSGINFVIKCLRLFPISTNQAGCLRFSHGCQVIDGLLKFLTFVLMDRLSGLNCLFGRQRQTMSASIGSASPPFKRRAHFVSAIFFINFGAYGTSLRFHEENGMNPNKIWRWLKKNRFRSQLDERWNAENQRRTTQNNNRVRAHTSTIYYLSGCKKHVIIRLFNRHFTKVWCKIVSSTPYNYPTCNAELFWLSIQRAWHQILYGIWCHGGRKVW